MLFKPWSALFGLGSTLLLVVSLLCAAGCSNNQQAERMQSNLNSLAVLYGQYLGQHRGQPPANEKELKDFIQSLVKAKKAPFKIDDVDSLFVSSRDGKPYFVLYGPAPKGPGPNLPSSTIIAYEQEGKGGTRFIARLIGGVESVDETQFKQLVPK